ncbi:MAG: hypothetical protein WA705_28965 [Candidatus Ozemobacteraceae bacterium]
MSIFRIDATTRSQSVIANLRQAGKGFVLPLVIGTMVVLTLFFATMSFLSSSQIQGASHFLDSTRALSIAKAGAEWAVVALASGTYLEKSDVAEPDFYKRLFSASQDEYEGEVQHPYELEQYVSGELGGSLRVRVKIFEIETLPVMGGDGFKGNPVEKSGKMEFSAVGTVGKASRRVRITKGFKVTMVVHPVLSKFTLFVRDKLPGQEVNVLKQETGNANFVNGCPIILNNQGPDEDGKQKTYPVVNPDQTFDLSCLQKPFDSRPYDFETLVRQSGWVFLNSQTPSQEWNLNLSGSGKNGDYDDRLLTRVGVYQNTYLKLPRTLPTKEIFKDLQERFEGIKTDYEVIDHGAKVAKIASEELALHYLFPTEPRSSLLRLFGTGSHFSPTLVFGPVSLTYLTIREISVILTSKEECPNVRVPGFPDLATFRDAVKVENVINIKDMDSNLVYFAKFFNFKRNDAGPSYDEYAHTMTMLSTAPFLQAMDCIYLPPVKLEQGSLGNPKGAQHPWPPPKIQAPQWVGGREDVVAGRGKFGPEDAPLFQGFLKDIDGCKEFQPKITAVFASFKELTDRFLQGNSLRLPGIVYVGTETCTISQPLQITSPGILISGGDIHIQSGVRSKFPVTLVSLNDISVETTDQIDAHLICLRGKFKAKGGFTIKGGLAAGSLEMSGSEMVNPFPKTIIFEPKHDPYSDPVNGIKKEFFRYQLSLEEEYSVEGGK